MKNDNPDITSSSFKFIRKGTWGWKVALIYDIFMMVLIIINLFCLSANAILMSDFGQWLFDFIRLPEILQFYKSDLRPWVVITEGWFTTFLICELLARWGIAIVQRHHRRWWFFHSYIGMKFSPLFHNCAFCVCYVRSRLAITCIVTVIKSFPSAGIVKAIFITTCSWRSFPAVWC